MVGIVQPLFVAEASSRAVQVKASLKVIDEFGPNRIVIGLPYNMDGSEGPRAKLVREFAAELAAHLPRFPRVEIAFQDERLSSFAAEERLARTGRTHGEKKALRDALAACAILEDYLRALRGASANPNGNMDADIGAELEIDGDDE